MIENDYRRPILNNDDTMDVNKLMAELERRHPGESEYLQAVREVLTTVEETYNRHPEFEANKIAERIVEPDRSFTFKVVWVDDRGCVQVNTGYRFQFNNAIGPYKGGLRFHPSVNPSILKFLGFEQIFKNALTTLPMGGAKGGSDFNPKGKSDAEVMRFCQAFMVELWRHIGPETDVPAGDIGVGGREIGYLYGQYKRITGLYEGVLTGKGLTWGGSLARKEATGYGLCYFTQAMMERNGKAIAGKTVVVSGSGNVAIYAVQKITEMGAKVVAMSDSNGYIYDPDGIKLDVVKQLKEVERKRIKEYVKAVPTATYTEGCSGIWTIPCQIALPCATQNEINEASAKALIANGVEAVGEGANMPSTLEATAAFQQAGVLFAPAKAANAGGVAVSALEMSQNSQRLSWTFEEVDAKLKDIMVNIFAKVDLAAHEYAKEGDYVAGANIAGFLKVADAMMAQGAV